MEEPTYWNRFWRRQVSRRRLITGAALAGGGLAAASIAGCGSSGDNGSGSNAPENTGGAVSRELPADAETVVDARRVVDAQGKVLKPPPPDQHGGTVRFQG